MDLPDDIPDDILNNLCPAQCNNKGKCQLGKSTKTKCICKLYGKYNVLEFIGFNIICIYWNACGKLQ